MLEVVNFTIASELLFSYLKQWYYFILYTHGWLTSNLATENESKYDDQWINHDSHEDFLKLKCLRIENSG